MFNKAYHMADLTFSIIEKSCNKIIVGKTFWKNIALPSILYGTDIMILNEQDIKKLQIIENSVYKKILGGTKNTATAALRGEIGSSAMKTRIMTNKILYFQSIMTRTKEVTKCILDKMKEEKDKWWRNVDYYLTELNETQECLRRLNKEEIKNKTRKLDSDKWKEELESKVSLEIYKEWKREIKEEDIGPYMITVFHQWFCFEQ